MLIKASKRLLQVGNAIVLKYTSFLGIVAAKIVDFAGFSKFAMKLNKYLCQPKIYINK